MAKMQFLKVFAIAVKKIYLKSSSFRSCSGCLVKSRLEKERKQEEQLENLYNGPGVKDGFSRKDGGGENEEIHAWRQS